MAITSGSVRIFSSWVPKFCSSTEIQKQTIFLFFPWQKVGKFTSLFQKWWVPEPIAQKLMGSQEPMEPMLTEPLTMTDKCNNLATYRIASHACDQKGILTKRHCLKSTNYWIKLFEFCFTFLLLSTCVFVAIKFKHSGIRKQNYL